MILADKLWIVILEGTEKSSKALSTYVVFLYNSLFQNNRLNILQILWDSQRGFSIPLSHGVSLSKWLYNAFKRRPYRETYKCFVSWYFCPDPTWVLQVITILLKGNMEVSGDVAFVGFRTYSIPKLPNIVSVMLEFSSTATHVKKSLTHSLREMEGSWKQNGSCQTLCVADLHSSK